MTIEWPMVRRAMLTQSNLFPDNPRANCMSTVISPEQLTIVNRCIKNFYQGLQWAEQFGIRGGYVSNRNFERIFLIDDQYALGVFDERNSRANSLQSSRIYPKTTTELVNTYQKRRSNIKTLIVLEKDNCRLANSDTVGNQSKFLIDVLYPAIAGIQARYSGDYTGSRWAKKLSEAQQHYTETSEDTTSIVHTSLLSEIYHNPRKADEQLINNSPLQLFYTWNSPLNIEVVSKENLFDQLLPFYLIETSHKP